MSKVKVCIFSYGFLLVNTHDIKRIHNSRKKDRTGARPHPILEFLLSSSFHLNSMCVHNSIASYVVYHSMRKRDPAVGKLVLESFLYYK